MGNYRLSSVIALLLICLDAFGAQYFVSKLGNDANSGLSGSPVLTITKGVSLLSAGDSLTVSNGVFNEFLAIPSSGTPGSQITIQAVDTNTIIDPSTDISGSWVTAPEVGAGVYKRTGLPLVVRYLSINNSNVASVYTNGDITAQIGNVFSGSGLTMGTQCLAVASSQTYLRDGVQCSFWDPLGALYCVDGTTCYLRLRDGSNPNTLTIRAAPRNDSHTTFQPSFATSAVGFSGRSNIVFKGFQIRNAFAAFYMLNSSYLTIQSNLIVGTFYRQYMEGSGSSNNVFTGNICVGNFYGNPGGNWEGGTSAVAENKHGTYVWGKYMMGESSTFDNPIKLFNCGNSNVVSWNVIYSGLGANGVSLSGDIANPMYGTKVFGNSISYQSSVGYLDSLGNTYSQIFSNAFVDCDVSYRPHELNTTGETTRTNFFYRNTSFLSGGLGNHVFCFAESSGGTYKPSISIYFNSFSGGNFAAQFNANTETSGACGHMLFFNNIFSGATAYFDGPPGFSTDANAVGAFDYNLVTPPSAGSTAWFGAHNIKTNSVWPNLAGMTFVLPPDSSAIGSALDASGTFTLNGHSYSGFPDGATKLGANWDMGALEKAPIWYVDINVGASGNGLAWATAWKDLTNIVWASVNPGDTILVSQGNYHGLTPTKGGTIGSNIVIAVAQSVGRNAGVTNTGFSSGFGNITLDGALNYGYSNNIQNTVVVPQITNNIGWHIVSTNTANVDGGGTCINISGTATNGIVLRWLELTQLSDHNEDYGIRFNYSAPNMQDNNEVGYCWIHQVGQDGIKNASGSFGSHMDQTVIHHCLIEKTGDDGCELNSGYSVVNCIIRDARDQIMRGHPDGISGQTFSYSRFANNIIWGFKRSECFYLNTFSQSNISVWSYGNLVYWGDTNTLEVSKTVGSYGMEDLYWAPQFGHTPGTSDTNIYWRDIRIFNNTFAAFPPYSVTPFAFFNRYKNGSDPNPGKWCTVWIDQGLMFNNVMYNGFGSAFGAANQIACDPTRLTIGWNNGFSTNANGKAWGTEDGSWATGEAMDAANPGWYGDSSAQPVFIAPYPPTWDYRISAQDFALTGQGTNLSAYVPSMPGLDVDLWGVPRGTTWDVGANQHTQVNTNWIVWLRMTNDFSAEGGKIVDSTGTGHDFYRLAVTNTAYPSNFLTRVSGTNWSGGRTNMVAKAREYFLQNPDPRAAFEIGTWAAMTNISAFTNATQFSLTCWIAEDGDRNNYSATVFDAGHAGLGCWSFGRYFSFPPTNNLMLTVSTNYAGGGNWDRDLSMVWPNSQQQFANQWHFYAFTFNNGQVNIYFDGTNCGSTTLIGVTALSIWPAANNEDTTQPYLPWIAFGCRTHNGNPNIWNWANPNDYPNNGWGSLGADDVRMFTECLTPGQVLDIYNQSNSGGGGGGGTSSSLARAVNVRIGKSFVGP